jgi:hypothetical protein
MGNFLPRPAKEVNVKRRNKTKDAGSVSEEEGGEKGGQVTRSAEGGLKVRCRVMGCTCGTVGTSRPSYQVEQGIVRLVT